MFETARKFLLTTERCTYFRIEHGGYCTVVIERVYAILFCFATYYEGGPRQWRETGHGRVVRDDEIKLLNCYYRYVKQLMRQAGKTTIVVLNPSLTWP